MGCRSWPSVTKIQRATGGVVRGLRHLAGHLVAGSGQGGGGGVESHTPERNVGSWRGEDGVAFAGQDRVEVSVGERPDVVVTKRAA